MIKKILIYGSGEVIVKGLAFFALPLYSYMILPEEYGILGYLGSLISFLPIIFTMLYLQAFIRFFVDIDTKELISTYFYLGIVLNLFYLICGVVIYYFFIEDYGIEFKHYIFSIGTSIVIYLFQILQMYYRAKGLSKDYIKFSVGYGIAGLILNFILLTYLEDNTLAMLLSGFIISIIASIIAYQILKEFISFEYANYHLSKSILKYSTPLIPGSIGAILFSQSDKLILVNYMDKVQLGIYTLATTIGLTMGYLGRAFFMAYQPIFYEKLSQGKKNEIEDGFWKNILLLLSALFTSLIIIVVIYQLINNKYSNGIYISLIFSLTYSFVAFSQMMELHLTYIKKTLYVSYIYGFTGFLTVTGLFFIIDILGANWVVLWLFLSSLSTSILMYFVGQRVLYLKYNKKYILLFYLTIILLATIFTFYFKG